MDAQKLRGMRTFEKGSFWQKMKAYPALVMPLVLGAMRKAQLMGTAMDARAFGAYKNRTWLIQLKMKTPDYLAFTVCIVLTAFALTLNFLII
jgi:energy-coupling factor transport system permease protein